MHPLAEIAVHKVVEFYDRYFATHVDMDTERGMGDEEAYYLLDSEIVSRMQTAGFVDLFKRYIWTQYCLNHLWVGRKPRSADPKSR